MTYRRGRLGFSSNNLRVSEFRHQFPAAASSSGQTYSSKAEISTHFILYLTLSGVNFLDLSRETFKDFTVGKEGQEKHICSSEKMHRIVHCATQTAALGDLDNVGGMTEIVHRWAVRGPQHLVSRSDATGAGL